MYKEKRKTHLCFFREFNNQYIISAVHQCISGISCLKPLLFWYLPFIFFSNIPTVKTLWITLVLSKAQISISASMKA